MQPPSPSSFAVAESPNGALDHSGNEAAPCGVLSPPRKLTPWALLVAQSFGEKAAQRVVDGRTNPCLLGGGGGGAAGLQQEVSLRLPSRYFGGTWLCDRAPATQRALVARRPAVSNPAAPPVAAVLTLREGVSPFLPAEAAPPVLVRRPDLTIVRPHPVAKYVRVGPRVDTSAPRQRRPIAPTPSQRKRNAQQEAIRKEKAARRRTRSVRQAKRLSLSSSSSASHVPSVVSFRGVDTVERRPRPRTRTLMPDGDATPSAASHPTEYAPPDPEDSAGPDALGASSASSRTSRTDPSTSSVLQQRRHTQRLDEVLSPRLAARRRRRLEATAALQRFLSEHRAVRQATDWKRLPRHRGSLSLGRRGTVMSIDVPMGHRRPSAVSSSSGVADMDHLLELSTNAPLPPAMLIDTVARLAAVAKTLLCARESAQAVPRPMSGRAPPLSLFKSTVTLAVFLEPETQPPQRAQSTTATSLRVPLQGAAPPPRNDTAAAGPSQFLAVEVHVLSSVWDVRCAIMDAARAKSCFNLLASGPWVFAGLDPPLQQLLRSLHHDFMTFYGDDDHLLYAGEHGRNVRYCRIEHRALSEALVPVFADFQARFERLLPMTSILQSMTLSQRLGAPNPGFFFPEQPFAEPLDILRANRPTVAEIASLLRPVKHAVMTQLERVRQMRQHDVTPFEEDDWTMLASAVPDESVSDLSDVVSSVPPAIAAARNRKAAAVAREEAVRPPTECTINRARPTMKEAAMAVLREVRRRRSREVHDWFTDRLNAVLADCHAVDSLRAAQKAFGSPASARRQTAATLSATDALSLLEFAQRQQRKVYFPSVTLSFRRIGGVAPPHPKEGPSQRFRVYTMQSGGSPLAAPAPAMLRAPALHQDDPTRRGIAVFEVESLCRQSINHARRLRIVRHARGAAAIADSVAKPFVPSAADAPGAEGDAAPARPGRRRGRLSEAASMAASSRESSIGSADSRRSDERRGERRKRPSSVPQGTGDPKAPHVRKARSASKPQRRSKKSRNASLAAASLSPSSRGSLLHPGQRQSVTPPPRSRKQSEHPSERRDPTGSSGPRTPIVADWGPGAAPSMASLVMDPSGEGGVALQVSPTLQVSTDVRSPTEDLSVDIDDFTEQRIRDAARMSENACFDLQDGTLRTNLLHEAVEQRLPRLSALLVELGCNPAAQDCKGNTPLHYAVERGAADVVTALMDALRKRFAVAQSLASRRSAKPRASVQAAQQARVQHRKSLFVQSRDDSVVRAVEAVTATPVALSEADSPDHAHVDAELLFVEEHVLQRNLGGETPLSLAVRSKNTAIAALLLRPPGLQPSAAMQSSLALSVATEDDTARCVHCDRADRKLLLGHLPPDHCIARGDTAFLQVLLSTGIVSMRTRCGPALQPLLQVALDANRRALGLVRDAASKVLTADQTAHLVWASPGVLKCAAASVLRQSCRESALDPLDAADLGGESSEEEATPPRAVVSEERAEHVVAALEALDVCAEAEAVVTFLIGVARDVGVDPLASPAHGRSVPLDFLAGWVPGLSSDHTQRSGFHAVLSDRRVVGWLAALLDASTRAMATARRNAEKDDKDKDREKEVMSARSHGTPPQTPGLVAPGGAVVMLSDALRSLCDRTGATLAHVAARCLPDEQADAALEELHRTAVDDVTIERRQRAKWSAEQESKEDEEAVVAAIAGERSPVTSHAVLSAVDHHGCTPIHVAVARSLTSVTRRFVRALGHLQCADAARVLALRNRDGDTVLGAAVRARFAAGVKLIMGMDARVVGGLLSARCSDGRSPLLAAVAAQAARHAFSFTSPLPGRAPTKSEMRATERRSRQHAVLTQQALLGSGGVVLSENPEDERPHCDARRERDVAHALIVPPVPRRGSSVGHSGGAIIAPDAPVETGAPLNERSGPRSETALHLACRHGLWHTAAMLLTHGADPTVPDHEGVTALRVAASSQRDVSLVRLLLANDRFAPESGAALRAIVCASGAASRHTDIVEGILRRAPIDLDSPLGAELLHAAASAGNAALVDRLMRVGARCSDTSGARSTLGALLSFWAYGAPHAVNTTRQVHLPVATDRDLFESVARRLLRLGFGVPPSALLLAVLGGFSELPYTLLRPKYRDAIDLNARCARSGRTVLMVAVELGARGTALLSRLCALVKDKAETGCPLNPCLPNHRHTALDLAVQKGNTLAVTMLVLTGAFIGLEQSPTFRAPVLDDAGATLRLGTPSLRVSRPESRESMATMARPSSEGGRHGRPGSSLGASVRSRSYGPVSPTLSNMETLDVEPSGSAFRMSLSMSELTVPESPLRTASSQPSFSNPPALGTPHRKAPLSGSAAASSLRTLLWIRNAAHLAPSAILRAAVVSGKPDVLRHLSAAAGSPAAFAALLSSDSVPAGPSHVLPTMALSDPRLAEHLEGKGLACVMIDDALAAAVALADCPCRLPDGASGGAVLSTLLQLIAPGRSGAVLPPMSGSRRPSFTHPPRDGQDVAIPAPSWCAAMAVALCRGDAATAARLSALQRDVQGDAEAAMAAILPGAHAAMTHARLHSPILPDAASWIVRRAVDLPVRVPCCALWLMLPALRSAADGTSRLHTLLRCGLPGFVGTVAPRQAAVSALEYTLTVPGWRSRWMVAPTEAVLSDVVFRALAAAEALDPGLRGGESAHPEQVLEMPPGCVIPGSDSPPSPTQVSPDPTAARGVLSAAVTPSALEWCIHRKVAATASLILSRRPLLELALDPHHVCTSTRRGDGPERVLLQPADKLLTLLLRTNRELRPLPSDTFFAIYGQPRVPEKSAPSPTKSRTSRSPKNAQRTGSTLLTSAMRQRTVSTLKSPTRSNSDVDGFQIDVPLLNDLPVPELTSPTAGLSVPSSARSVTGDGIVTAVGRAAVPLVDDALACAAVDRARECVAPWREHSFVWADHLLGISAATRVSNVARPGQDRAEPAAVAGAAGSSRQLRGFASSRLVDTGAKAPSKAPAGGKASKPSRRITQAMREAFPCLTLLKIVAAEDPCTSLPAGTGRHHGPLAPQRPPPTEHTVTPLHAAIASGRTQVVGRILKASDRSLVAASGPPQSANGPMIIGPQGARSSPPASPSAMRRGGSIETPSVPLRRRGRRSPAVSIDVNALDAWGRTPLHTAAWVAHVSGARLLLKAGADMSIEDAFGETPLHVAARLALPPQDDVPRPMPARSVSGASDGVLSADPNAGASSLQAQSIGGSVISLPRGPVSGAGSLVGSAPGSDVFGPPQGPPQGPEEDAMSATGSELSVASSVGTGRGHHTTVLEALLNTPAAGDAWLYASTRRPTRSIALVSALRGGNGDAALTLLRCRAAPPAEKLHSIRVAPAEESLLHIAATALAVSVAGPSGQVHALADALLLLMDRAAMSPARDLQGATPVELALRALRGPRPGPGTHAATLMRHVTSTLESLRLRTEPTIPPLVAASSDPSPGCPQPRGSVLAAPTPIGAHYSATQALTAAREAGETQFLSAAPEGPTVHGSLSTTFWLLHPNALAAFRGNDVALCTFLDHHAEAAAPDLAHPIDAQAWDCAVCGDDTTLRTLLRRGEHDQRRLCATDLPPIVAQTKAQTQLGRDIAAALYPYGGVDGGVRVHAPESVTTKDGGHLHTAAAQTEVVAGHTAEFSVMDESAIPHLLQADVYVQRMRITLQRAPPHGPTYRDAPCIPRHVRDVVVQYRNGTRHRVTYTVEESLLHHACRTGCLRSMRFVIENNSPGGGALSAVGARLLGAAYDRDGLTPFHCALLHRQFGIVAELMRAKVPMRPDAVLGLHPMELLPSQAHVNLLMLSLPPHFVKTFADGRDQQPFADALTRTDASLSPNAPRRSPPSLLYGDAPPSHTDLYPRLTWRDDGVLQWCLLNRTGMAGPDAARRKAREMNAFLADDAPALEIQALLSTFAAKVQQRILTGTCVADERPKAPPEDPPHSRQRSIHDRFAVPAVSRHETAAAVRPNPPHRGLTLEPSRGLPEGLKWLTHPAPDPVRPATHSPHRPSLIASGLRRLAHRAGDATFRAVTTALSSVQVSVEVAGADSRPSASEREHFKHILRYGFGGGVGARVFDTMASVFVERLGVFGWMCLSFLRGIKLIPVQPPGTRVANGTISPLGGIYCTPSAVSCLFAHRTETTTPMAFGDVTVLLNFGPEVLRLPADKHQHTNTPVTEDPFALSRGVMRIPTLATHLKNFFAADAVQASLRLATAIPSRLPALTTRVFIMDDSFALLRRIGVALSARHIFASQAAHAGDSASSHGFASSRSSVSNDGPHGPDPSQSAEAQLGLLLNRLSTPVHSSRATALGMGDLIGHAVDEPLLDDEKHRPPGAVYGLEDRVRQAKVLERNVASVLDAVGVIARDVLTATETGPAEGGPQRSPRMSPRESVRTLYLGSTGHELSASCTVQVLFAPALHLPPELVPVSLYRGLALLQNTASDSAREGLDLLWTARRGVMQEETLYLVCPLHEVVPAEVHAADSAATPATTPVARLERTPSNRRRTVLEVLDDEAERPAGPDDGLSELWASVGVRPPAEERGVVTKLESNDAGHTTAATRFAAAPPLIDDAYDASAWSPKPAVPNSKTDRSLRPQSLVGSWKPLDVSEVFLAYGSSPGFNARSLDRYEWPASAPPPKASAVPPPVSPSAERLAKFRAANKQNAKQETAVTPPASPSRPPPSLAVSNQTPANGWWPARHGTTHMCAAAVLELGAEAAQCLLTRYPPPDASASASPTSDSRHFSLPARLRGSISLTGHGRGKPVARLVNPATLDLIVKAHFEAHLDLRGTLLLAQVCRAWNGAVRRWVPHMERSLRCWVSAVVCRAERDVLALLRRAPRPMVQVALHPLRVEWDGQEADIAPAGLGQLVPHGEEHDVAFALGLERPQDAAAALLRFLVQPLLQLQRVASARSLPVAVAAAALSAGSCNRRGDFGAAPAVIARYAAAAAAYQRVLVDGTRDINALRRWHRLAAETA